MSKRKRLFILVTVILILVLGLLGCSESTTKESQSKETESTITESKNDSEIKYAELIPDPKVIFTNGNISVTDQDGGKAYIFEVSNFNDGEFVSYVSECKELGFDDISYDTEKEFGAYTSDGKYWAQVNLDDEKNIIYVICQESKKK